MTPRKFHFFDGCIIIDRKRKKCYNVPVCRFAGHTADHCSNIAACVLDAAEQNLNLHASVRTAKTDSAYFKEQYARYAEKYLLPLQ